ncbi:MAG: NAD(P)H-dependent oxidoreductase [Aerococcaceae bacterium]|nr:NAD(P)H-dependent oxidoreductase [Aerococcaceae bacterium]
MKTIVYIAHEEITQSSSQQFLLQSGQALTNAIFVDLHAEWQKNGTFDTQVEQQRLMQYERILFQFPLYWYQAPSILKQWMDTVFDTSKALQMHLQRCQLGLVVVAGVKASAYQAGGKEQRTLSELLSPYEALARYFGMTYLPIFAIHQFQYLTETEQMDLMMRYACYIETGTIDHFGTYQQFLLEKLENTHLKLTEEQQLMWEFFVREIEQQQQELAELTSITQDW